MSNLGVDICGVHFNNPVIAASGTFGFGQEYNKFYSLDTIGGISLKGTTPLERPGNKANRIAETPMGMLNAVGLQNPGIDYVVEHYLPLLENCGCRLIANIAGNTVEDYCIVAEKLRDTCIDMIEMNISCPNVKKGGVQFGTKPEAIFDITSEVKRFSKQPLIVKLSPNVTDIKENAIAAQEAGADALSLINTLTGMAIDIKTRRPVLANVTGGLSGPCVKPVALRMVHDVYTVTKLPIIGMGGISCATDAIEFMMAGATAVMVGTANFTNPYACPEIIKGLEDYCRDNNIEKISDLTGSLIV